MTRRTNGEDDSSYPITKHAHEQLLKRWSETVRQPHDLDRVTVPVDARLVGYDGATGALFLDVPGTPMVAIVQGDVVVTFLAKDAAEFKLKLKGYGPSDFTSGT